MDKRPAAVRVFPISDRREPSIPQYSPAFCRLVRNRRRFVNPYLEEDSMIPNQTTTNPDQASIVQPNITEPATLTVELKHGFRTITEGREVFHKTVIMRESLTNDLFEAEKMVDSSDRPIAFNGALMGLQIVKIGDHPGPLSLKEIGTLKKQDYSLLREKQMELERLGESG